MHSSRSRQFLSASLHLVLSLCDWCRRPIASKLNGQKLLKEWLSPEQFALYNKHRYFEVIGSSTGKRYRILARRELNVLELDNAGIPRAGWCFVPDGALVAGDVMLAQKIALETNELDALAVARQFVPKSSS